MPWLTAEDFDAMGLATGPRRRILHALGKEKAPPPRPAPPDADKPDGARASWHCPISMEVFRDPVVCACGHTFERACIEAWLRKNDTSPATGEILPHKNLVPNHTLRSDIAEWRDAKVYAKARAPGTARVRR